MMEGTITLKSTAGGKLYGRILWEAESNGTAANTSAVTARLQLRRQSGFTTTGTWKGSLTVGGTTANISYAGSVGSSWVTVKTLKATVSHSADGSGTCYIYGKVSGPGGTSMAGASVSGSETVALEKIARFAAIVSVSAFTDEGNPVLGYSNPAGEAAQNLAAALSVDGETPVAAYRSLSGTGKSYTFSLTEEERTALRNASSKSNSLKLYVLLRSSVGGVSYVDKAYVTMRLVNADPTVNPVIADTNSETIALTGDSSILVAQHSKAKVTVNAQAKKGASIQKIRVTHGSTVLTGDGTLDIVNDAIEITVTDSRGNTVTCTAPNRIIPYIDPTAVIENAMPNGEGEMELTATGKVFNGSFGKAENAVSLHYRFREGSGSYGSWIPFDTMTLEGADYTAASPVTGLDYRKTYTFQVAVYDSLHPEGVLSAARKFTAKPIADWSGEDWRFNVPVSMAGNPISGLGEPANSTDALSLGAAQVRFAPVGHGLGASQLLTTDLDSAVSPGWYHRSETTTIGGVTANYWHLHVSAYSTGSSHCVQDLYPVLDSGYCHIVRRKYTGTWEEAEVENPPFRTGIEYRTTERRNGKAVYKKADGDGHILFRLDGEDTWRYEQTHTVKLWENPNPAESFDAQTLALDLLNYDGVCVYFKNEISGSVFLNTGLIPKGMSGALFYVTSAGKQSSRKFTVSAGGIAFENAHYDGQIGKQDHDIPVIVYGVKGIQ